MEDTRNTFLSSDNDVTVENEDEILRHSDQLKNKNNANDGKGLETIEILSQKDLKIIQLKSQLEDLKSRNCGLINCVKNQNSAVRKLGSIVASKHSGGVDDVIDSSKADDVIDYTLKNVRDMQRLKHAEFRNNPKKGVQIKIQGTATMLERRQIGKDIRGVDMVEEDREMDSQRNGDSKDESFERRIQELEDTIFARETAFRQLTKEKPINEKMLSLRLDQLRDERDDLFCILKHYESIMTHCIGNTDGNNVVGGDNWGTRVPMMEIKAEITINDKKQQDLRREELLFHIEELRKCLEEIKKKRKNSKSRERHNKSLQELNYSRLNNHVRLLDNGSKENDRGDILQPDNITKNQVRVLEDQCNGTGPEDDDWQRDKDSLNEFVSERPRTEDDARSITPENIEKRGKDVLKSKPVLSNFRNLAPGNNRQKTKFSALPEENKDRNHNNKIVMSDALKEDKNMQSTEKWIESEPDGGDDRVDKGISKNNKKVAEIKRDAVQPSNHLSKYEEQLKKYDDLINNAGISRSNSDTDSEKRDSIISDDRRNVTLTTSKQPKNVAKQCFVTREQDNSCVGREGANILAIKMRDLENSNVEMMRINKRLRNEIQHLRNRNRDVLDENSEMKTQIRDLKKHSEDLDEISRDLEDRNIEQGKQLDDNERMNQILSEKVLASKNQMKTLNEDKLISEKLRENLSEQLRKAKVELSKIKMEKEIMGNEIASLEKEKNDGLIEIDDLQRILREKKEVLTRSEKTCETAQKSERILKGRLQELSEQNKNIQKRLNDAEEDIKREKSNSVLFKRIIDDDDEKQKLMKKTIDEIKAECEEERAKIQEMADDRKQIVEKNLRLEREKEAADRSKNDLENGMKKSLDELDSLKRKLLKKSEEALESTRILRLGQRELDDTKSELDKMNCLISELQKKIFIMKQECSDLRIERKEIDNEKQQALSKLEEELNTNLILRKEAEKKEEEMDRLSEKLEAANRELQGLSEKFRSTKDYADALTSEKNKVEEENVDLLRQLKDKHQEIVKNKEQIKVLENRVKNEEGNTREIESSLQKKSDQYEKLERDYDLLKIGRQTTMKEFIGLQKQLENSWTEKEDLNIELQKSLKRVEDLTRKLDSADDERGDLESEIKLFREELDMKEFKLKEMERKSSTIYQDAIFKGKEIERIGHELTSAQYMLQVKESVINNSGNEVEKLKNHLQQMSSENEKLQERLAREKHAAAKAANDCKSRDEAMKSLETKLQQLRTKTAMELAEKEGRWQLFQEHNKSLKTQLDTYKRKEIKLQGNARSMQREVGLITEELAKTKQILNDFKKALTDKDNDLRKINDAVVLLERSYALRQTEVQMKLSQVKEDFDASTDQVKVLSQTLLEREKEIEDLRSKRDECYARNNAYNEENKNLESIVKRLEAMLTEKSSLLRLKDEEINNRAAEISRIKAKHKTEGQEVHDLVNKLEVNLKDVRTQLQNVEKEKEYLKDECLSKEKRIDSLRNSLMEMKKMLKMKEDDIEKEKLQQEEFRKSFATKQRLEEERKMEGLQKELASVRNESKASIEMLKKEKESENIARNADRLEKDSLKGDLRNMEDEARRIKKMHNIELREMERYIEDLQHQLDIGRRKENEAAEREIEYRQKLNEMSGTVNILEKKISEAVTRAEDERNERETVLTRVLESRYREKDETLDFYKLEAEKWQKRAQFLTTDLDELKDKFSRFQSKNRSDTDIILSEVQNAKAEQILNLKRELAETYKDKLSYQSKMNDLNHEIRKLRNLNQQIKKDFDAINEELRKTRNVTLIKKAQIEWLRNARESKR